MEKSRQCGGATKLARFDQDEEDRLFVNYLRKKLQDPDGLHPDSGGPIPTLDVFSIDPDILIQEKHMLPHKLLITVMPLEGKDVWYFFSPMERPPRSHISDRSVGEHFWKERSPQKNIVDEEGRKIGERRRRRFRNWAMHEYRLVDPQQTETSTAKKTIESNTSDNQARSKWHKYVLCKIFKEAAAEKQEKDEPAAEARRIKEEASTTDRGQVAQSTPLLYIPPDDCLYWKDPAEECDEQLVTEPLATWSSAGAVSSSKTDTTAASRPRESPGPYTPDQPAPDRRRGGFTASLPDLKEHHLLMKLPFEPLPWLGRPPIKRKVITSARMHTRGEAEDTRSGRNPGSQHDLESDSSSSTAESSTPPKTQQKDDALLQ